MKTDLYTAPKPSGYLSHFQMDELNKANYARRTTACVVVNLNPHLGATPIYAGQPVSPVPLRPFDRDKLKELVLILDRLGRERPYQMADYMQLRQEIQQRSSLARHKAKELRDYLGDE